MATTGLRQTSDLRRRQWMTEGLLDASMGSYWTAFTGSTQESVIYQVKNSGAADNGNRVTFQYDAQLSEPPVEGRETAFGTGEEKKQYSSSIEVKRYRFTADNGDRFDGKDYGSMGLNEHADSRNKLAKKYQKWKDQTIFDAMQGTTSQPASHIITLDDGLSYNELINLETYITTATGFQSNSVKRAPLKPYMGNMMMNPCWLFVVDPYAAAQLKRDPDYQTIVVGADMRGKDNKALSMVLGKIGNLMIMEAQSFFGKTSGSVNTLSNTAVEFAGLRLKDANDVWKGQPGYVDTGAHTSRGVLLGAGAIQMALGKEPDYQVQRSVDYGITTESMCEVWTNVQKTVLTAELSDNEDAKFGGFDFGVIAVDIPIPATS